MMRSCELSLLDGLVRNWTGSLTLNQEVISRKDSSDRRVAMGLFRRLLHKLKAKHRVTARETTTGAETLPRVERDNRKVPEIRLLEEFLKLCEAPRMPDVIEASLQEEVKCRKLPINK
jgi:hypothetical protein